VNGHREKRLPNTSNIHFEGADAEGLLLLLDEKGVCCSPGSACSTGKVEPSRILLAMGFSKERARSSVRFSFSACNTAGEADAAAGIVAAAVGRIRSLRPAAGGRVILHGP
jgi:cysteine desulfurase